MKNILLVYNLIPKKNIFFFWITIISTVIKSLLDLIGLGSLVPFIYAIFDQEKLINNKYLLSLNLEQYTELQIIYFFIIIIFSVFLIKNIFIFFHNYLLSTYLKSVFVNLSKKILSNSIDLYDGKKDYNSTEITKFLYQEVNGYAFKFLGNIFIIASDVFFITIFIVLIAFQSNGLPLLFILPLFLVGLIYYQIVKKYTQSIGDKRLMYDTNRLKGIKEIFDSLKVIKVLGKIDNFINYIEKSTHKSANQNRKFTIISKILIILIEMLVITTLCVIVYIFSNNLDQLESFLPLLIFIFISSIKFIPMLSRLTISIQKIKFNQKSIIKLHKFSNQKIVNKFKEKKILSFEKNIQIKNLNFSYDKSSNILENLNLSISKNECIGIVGTSGRGKTTLLEILCGILDNFDGSIISDEKFLNAKEFRLNASYVSQDTRILNSSFKENITLDLKKNGNLFDEKKYNDSINHSNLSEFVQKLPEKHDTILGEFGSSISGGQRQRIGIARALYHNSEILILDEFTSSLDDSTEKKILEDIKVIKKFKTIIISTHKNDILSICDKIYEIDQKKLKILK